MKQEIIEIIEKINGVSFMAHLDENLTAVEREALAVVDFCSEMLSRCRLIADNPELLVELPVEALEPWDEPGTRQHRFVPAHDPVADASTALVTGRGYIDLIKLIEWVRGTTDVKEIARRADVPYSTAKYITSQQGNPAANVELLLNAALPVFQDELPEIGQLAIDSLMGNTVATIASLVEQIKATPVKDDGLIKIIAVNETLLVDAEMTTNTIRQRWVMAEYKTCEVYATNGLKWARLVCDDPFKTVIIYSENQL